MISSQTSFYVGQDLKEDITSDFLRLIASPALKAEDFDMLRFQVASTPLFPGMQTSPKHKAPSMEAPLKDVTGQQTAPQFNEDFISQASLFGEDNSFMDSYKAWKKQKPSKAKGVFQCDLCGKEYSYKRGLRRHMWVCADVKRFQCEFCAQTFNLREQYRKHLKECHSAATVPFQEIKPFQLIPE
nr:zinc finger protein PLAGL1-like [Biomphalaria glabrata]